MEPLTIVGLISEFFKQNKVLLVYYIGFLSIVSIKDIGVPHLFGQLVKAIQTGTSLLQPMVLLFALTVVIQAGHMLIEYLEVENSPKLQEFLRQKLMHFLMDKINTNHQELETGKIMAKLMRIPHAIYHFINQWRYTYIPIGIFSCAATVYFSLQNLYLGIVLCILLLICISTLLVAVHFCYNHSYMSEQSITMLFERVDDVLRNISTVTNAATEENELRDLRRHEHRYKKNITNALVCSMKVRSIIIPFNLLYFAFFISFCYTQVQHGKMDPSQFVALVIILFKVFGNVWDISYSINDTAARYGMIKESLELFNKFSSVRSISYDDNAHGYGFHESEDIQQGHNLDGIMLKNLGFRYNNKIVFLNLNVHFPLKHVTAIKGRNGSGKSTLLKILLKQMLPSFGEVYLNGTPYKALEPRYVRELMGYVGQTPILFDRSVYENITYGLPKDKVGVAVVEEVVSKFGLRPFVESLPNGLETRSGKHGSNLSGGQKQLILLIKLLVQDPPFVLLDEPTSALDDNMKELFYKILRQVFVDRTVIVVSHDEAILAHVDFVYNINSREMTKMYFNS